MLRNSSSRLTQKRRIDSVKDTLKNVELVVSRSNSDGERTIGKEITDKGRKGTSEIDEAELVEQTPLSTSSRRPFRVRKKHHQQAVPHRETLLDIMVEEHERFRGGPEPSKDKLERRKDRGMLQEP